MFLRQRFDLERSEVGVAGAEIEPELYDGLGHGRELGPNTPAKPSPSGADPRPARRLAFELTYAAADDTAGRRPVHEG
jgi:hypothetical protein